MYWKDVLNADVTDWLLEPDNPSIRFWALQDLEDRERSENDVHAAQDAIMESACVKKILAAQGLDGHWVNAESMYLPKYKATTHSLLILAELGARRTPAIEWGIEHMFRFQRNSGHFLPDLPKSSQGRASTMKDCCCMDGNILYYMLHFGYFDDSRVQRLVDFIVSHHSIRDAGWHCRAYPLDPKGVFPVNCYMGAVKVLKALAAVPEERLSSSIKVIINREVENILENKVYKYRKSIDGSRIEKPGWKRFTFPLFYQSDALEVLDVLTRLGVRDDRMRDAVGLVLSSQGPDGKWLLKESFNGKMWSDIEAKGKPSKWITLRALRTLRRFYGD